MRSTLFRTCRWSARSSENSRKMHDPGPRMGRGPHLSKAGVVSSMKRSIAARPIAFAALIALVACGGESSTEPTPTAASIAGVWHLRTIGGSPLPYVIQDPSARMTITASTVTVTEGGTWSEMDEFTLSVNGGPAVAQTHATSRTYIRNGSSFTAVETNGAVTNYTFDGSSLTSLETPALRYTR